MKQSSPAAARKQSSPAAARNKEPIREVLARHLPERGLVLEIASGTGEHAAHMAAHFPGLRWQPTDADPAALASIEAWRAEAALPNLLPPLALDVTAPAWPVAEADAIVCVNMVHISPWEASLALFDGAARVLAPAGVLFLYGPYRFDGATAPSNEEFDRSLRARDPRWGVRDVRDLGAAALARGFHLAHVVAMPANNHSLVFERRAADGAVRTRTAG
jgi:SAM-dependent methyltransferase